MKNVFEESLKSQSEIAELMCSFKPEIDNILSNINKPLIDIEGIEHNIIGYVIYYHRVGQDVIDGPYEKGIEFSFILENIDIMDRPNIEFRINTKYEEETTDTKLFKYSENFGKLTINKYNGKIQNDDTMKEYFKNMKPIIEKLLKKIEKSKPKIGMGKGKWSSMIKFKNGVLEKNCDNIS